MKADHAAGSLQLAVGGEVGSLLGGVCSGAEEVSVVGEGLVETIMETGGSIQGEVEVQVGAVEEEEEEKFIDKEEGEVGVPVGTTRMLIPGEKMG